MVARVTFVNLTPHQINIKLADGSMLNIEPSGQLARVTSTSSFVVEEDGIPVFDNEWSEVEGLPAPVDGVRYIVSMLVLNRISGRDDVRAPGTGPADNVIRENGQVVAVTRLIRR